MNMMKVVSAVVVVLIGSPGWAQTQQNPPTPGDQTAAPRVEARETKSGTLSSKDRDFIRSAAIGGLAEVELGRMASQKAMSAAVKQFGQRMVTDHGKANDELKALS